MCATSLTKAWSISAKRTDPKNNLKGDIIMKKIFKVEGVDCANCAAKIERGIQAVDGVSRCTLSFMTSKLTIEADDAKMDTVIGEAKKIMRKVEPDAVLK